MNFIIIGSDNIADTVPHKWLMKVIERAPLLVQRRIFWQPITKTLKIRQTTVQTPDLKSLGMTRKTICTKSVQQIQQNQIQLS